MRKSNVFFVFSFMCHIPQLLSTLSAVFSLFHSMGSMFTYIYLCILWKPEIRADIMIIISIFIGIILSYLRVSYEWLNVFSLQTYPIPGNTLCPETDNLQTFCSGGTRSISWLGLPRKSTSPVNTLSLTLNWHFTGGISKCIFLNENIWILIKISLFFVPKGPINNFPALVQIHSGSVTFNILWRFYESKCQKYLIMTFLTEENTVINLYNRFQSLRGTGF